MVELGLGAGSQKVEIPMRLKIEMEAAELPGARHCCPSPPLHAWISTSGSCILSRRRHPTPAKMFKKGFVVEIVQVVFPTQS